MSGLARIWLIVLTAGKRFLVRADEKLMAFVELEAATQAEQPIA